MAETLTAPDAVIVALDPTTALASAPLVISASEMAPAPLPMLKLLRMPPALALFCSTSTPTVKSPDVVTPPENVARVPAATVAIGLRAEIAIPPPPFTETLAVAMFLPVAVTERVPDPASITVAAPLRYAVLAVSTIASTIAVVAMVAIPPVTLAVATATLSTSDVAVARFTPDAATVRPTLCSTSSNSACVRPSISAIGTVPLRARPPMLVVSVSAVAVLCEVAETATLPVDMTLCPTTIASVTALVSIRATTPAAVTPPSATPNDDVSAVTVCVLVAVTDTEPDDAIVPSIVATVGADRMPFATKTPAWKKPPPGEKM